MRGGSYTGELDEKRWALVVGHLSVRDSVKGIWGRAPLLGNPKDAVFEGYTKCPVDGNPSS